MMASIFAAMFLAFVLGWLGLRLPAIGALAICFGLSVWLFLYEVSSPEYGFRMPWIQTLLSDVPHAFAEA